MKGWKLWVIALILVGLPALGARAQLRPADEQPELPEFESEPAEERRLELPEIPSPPRNGRLSSGGRLFVKQVRVTGSTVFTPEEIAVVTRPYEGREISPQELTDLRNALTRLYVEAGYVTSGALIPDQKIDDGVVELRVEEGELEGLVVAGQRRFRRSYLEERIALGAVSPLNVRTIEERLQLLKQDDRIKRVDARLAPGHERGQSVLRVDLEEARPWRLWLRASNERSPTVGSEGGGFTFQHRNVSGNGDVFTLLGEVTEGFWDIEGRYTFPLTARDTRLELRIRQSKAEVEERPFDELEIESDSVTYAIGLSHPFIRDLSHELRVGLVGEHRRSDTGYIFGDFDFIPGSDEGEVKISVLRFFQEFTQRSPERVIAARSTFNFGVSWMRATTNSGDLPDSRYFAWLGQFQIAQRLWGRFDGIQALLRGDIQLANDPLLSLEQMAVGGMRTVRGYRENELVRDNGYAVSIELRIPVWHDALGRDVLQVAPFFDVGKSWNDKVTKGPETLASVGLGVLFRPRDHILMQLYWGGRLRHVHRRGNDIQNNGFHWRVEVGF